MIQPQIREMLEAHMLQAFLENDSAFLSWLDWFYGAGEEDVVIDANGGQWKRGVTKEQQLAIARYEGRYVTRDGQERFIAPRNIELVVIEQNPHASEKTGKKSRGQELVEFGFDVAQVIANNMYLGMLVAKEDTCYLHMYHNHK